MAIAEPSALTLEQRDTIQYALIVDLHQMMEDTAKVLHELHESKDMAAGVTSADAQSHCRMVRDSLDALDAFGWPGEM